MYDAYLPDIDVADGLKRVMKNKTLYLSLLGRFKAREMTDDLVEKISNGDRKEVAHAAHAIKGATSNLGMKRMWEITCAIEECAKKDGDYAALIPRLYDALDDAERIIGALQAELAT